MSFVGSLKEEDCDSQEETGSPHFIPDTRSLNGFSVYQAPPRPPAPDLIKLKKGRHEEASKRPEASTSQLEGNADSSLKPAPDTLEADSTEDTIMPQAKSRPPPRPPLPASYRTISSAPSSGASEEYSPSNPEEGEMAFTLDSSGGSVTCSRNNPFLQQTEQTSPNALLTSSVDFLPAEMQSFDDSLGGSSNESSPHSAPSQPNAMFSFEDAPPLNNSPEPLTSGPYSPNSSALGESLPEEEETPVSEPMPGSPPRDTPTPTDDLAFSSGYDWPNTLDDLEDVGRAQVCVLSVEGLNSGESGGKKGDGGVYVALKLGSTQFRTAAVPKTPNHVWNEEFSFNIADITDTINVTVSTDQDLLLGRVAVPLLLNTRPNACKIEYSEELTLALKDKRLERSAKSGGSIKIRIRVCANLLRAAVRTFERQEVILPQDSFNMSLFRQNSTRLMRLVSVASKVKDYVEGLLVWDSPGKTVAAFLTFEVTVYHFDLFMLPLGTLVFMLAYPRLLSSGSLDRFMPDTEDINPEKDQVAYVAISGKDGGSSPSKKTFSLNTKTPALVQNSMGLLASTVERLKNLASFNSPFLSGLTAVFLLVATIVLYLVPARQLLMLWGAKKFSNKLLRPDYKPYSKPLSFLMRVPDDRSLSQTRPLTEQDLLFEETRKSNDKPADTVKAAKKLVSKAINKAPSLPFEMSLPQSLFGFQLPRKASAK